MRLSFHVSISSSTSYYYHARTLSLYICITILVVVLFLLLSAHAFSLLQRFQRRFFSRESCGVVLSIRVFVIQHDEIAIRDVESAQLFQRGFGVVNVLVHHVRGTLRRPRVPDANLTYRAVFAEDVVDVLVGNAEGQIADVQNAIDLGRELFVRERPLRLILTTTTRRRSRRGVGGGLHDDSRLLPPRRARTGEEDDKVLLCGRNGFQFSNSYFRSLLLIGRSN